MSKNIITSSEAWIYVDGVNKSYFQNTPEGREILRQDCEAMGLQEAFDEVMAVWGDDVILPALDEMKAERLNELRCAFDQRVTGSITTTMGYTMQFDTSDSLKMQGAITLLEATGATEGYLTQANDETVYHVPLATMRAVLVEMLAAYAACHARKQELRAAINAAQTAEELAAIEIAWPV